MSTLPSNPNLEQLRHQARDLLRAVRAGEPAATARLRSLSAPGEVTLAGAQLAIAREYGFASWPALKAEVEARNRTLAEAVDSFLTFSVNGRIGRAGQLLGRHPEIADYDVRTTIALGDAARVSAQLDRDPDLIGRRDPGTGWTAIHLACASRWHVDPARAEGLARIARMLLDAGADLLSRPTPASQWSPLRCAVASAGSGRGNEPVVRLLLERGAEVADDDLYLAGFATGGEQWCVRLLLAHTPDVRRVVAKAMAAPISLDDVNGVRVLLEAGADPGRYHDDEGEPTRIVRAALGAGCGLETIELLLDHGADPNETGDDGRSAYAVATASGRGDLLELFKRHGARDDTKPIDRLRYACLKGDRAAAGQLLDEHPALRSELSQADGSTLVAAAESGNTEALDLLLELGFPVAAKGGDDGATALHAAAWAGSSAATRKLLAAGAPLEALDSSWNSTPLDWAVVGSGFHQSTNPTPNWIETVRLLLDAGADASQISLDPAAPKQPSADVAEFLHDRGVVPRALTPS